MKNFTFYSPTFFSFGKGSEETGVLRGFVQLNAEDCRKIYELMV